MPHALATHATPPPDFFVGTWATRIQLPVHHPGSTQSPGAHPAIELVDDTIEIRGRTERSAGTDGRYMDAFFPCGITLPRYRVRGLGAEATDLHRLAVMDHLFDEGFLPTVKPFPIHPATRDSFVFLSKTVAIQAGIQMDNPEADDWPDSHKLRDHGRDHDQDGELGIALICDLRDNLRPHPAIVKGWRLVTLHGALRLRFKVRLEAKSTDCMQGTAESVGDIDTHAFSIETATSDGLIRHERASFARDVAQDFQLAPDKARTGSVTMLRIKDASNRSIRDMVFP